MKILVLADSHTDVDTMKDVADLVHPDRVVHLGDHIVDAILLKKRLPTLPFDLVRGNCDRSSQYSDEKILRVDSLVIFMAHGDQYQVESGIDQIAKAGKEAGAQIILHGHTHKPELVSMQGMTILCPGRIGRISSKKIDATYGVIETSGNCIQCHIYSYDPVTNSSVLISV